MTELIRASGPDRYFGGTIETFALPMGAFIVISLVLFYIYRRPHNVPRLKYLRPAHQIAFGTREPGHAGLISVAPRATAAAPPPATEAPAAPEAHVEAPAAPEADPPEAAEAAAPEAATPDAKGDTPSAEGETF